MASAYEGVPDAEEAGVGAEEVGVGSAPLGAEAAGGGAVSSISIIPTRQDFCQKNKLKPSVASYFETRDITIEELLDFDADDLEEFCIDLTNELKKDFDTLSKKRFLKGIAGLKEAENQAVAGMIGADGVPVMSGVLPPGGMTSISGEGGDQISVGQLVGVGGTTSLMGEPAADGGSETGLVSSTSAAGGSTTSGGTGTSGSGGPPRPKPPIHALMDRKQHEMMQRVYARYDKAVGMLEMLQSSEERLKSTSERCKQYTKVQMGKLIEQLKLRKSQLLKELEDVRKDKIEKLEQQLEDLMQYKQSIEHGQRQYDELVGDDSLTVHQRKKKVLRMTHSIIDSKPSLVMVTQPMVKFEFSELALDRFLNGIIIDDCDVPQAPNVRIIKVTHSSVVVEFCLQPKDLLKDVQSYALELCLVEVVSLKKKRRKKKARKRRKRKKKKKSRYSSSEESSSSSSSSDESSSEESSSEVSSSSSSEESEEDSDDLKMDEDERRKRKKKKMKKKKKKRKKKKRKSGGYGSSDDDSDSDSDSSSEDESDHGEEALYSGDEADSTLYGRKRAEKLVTNLGAYEVHERDDFGDLGHLFLMSGRSVSKLEWRCVKLYDAKQIHVAMCGLSSKFDDVRSEQLSAMISEIDDDSRDMRDRQARLDESDSHKTKYQRGILLKGSLFGDGVIRTVIPKLKQRGRYILRIRGENNNGWGLYSKPLEFRVKECIIQSKLIYGKEIDILMRFLSKKERSKKIKLLYRGSRDGFSSYNFHTKCDNAGPTLTIIESTNGNIFGGYASVSWTSNSAYVTDSNAFIYLLRSKAGKKIGKFGVTNTTNALYHNSGYGPTFGGGFDIYIAANCNTNSNSYSNAGNSFSCAQDQTLFAGAYNFMVKDLEVFGIK